MVALIVLLPLAAALVLMAFPNHARRASAWFAAGATLLAGLVLASLTPEVVSGGIVRASWAWLPFEGARFGFRADGLAWMFAAIILAIGALVILYAGYYLADRDPIARFYAFFMAFMSAMLGIVLADNLLFLVVCWELTGLTSFLLIGYWQGATDARQGARMALTVTGAGGLALLGGVLLLGDIVGTFDLDTVLASGDLLRADARYPAVVLLVLAGVFTKSAQIPFNFWLPSAMAAPTPVSAYLHSATMVKAGVFLLARLHPALAGSDLWFYVVSSIGLGTMLLGAWVAIFQHDLKGLLAYSTISHLGLITLLFGLNSPLAAVAGVFHILNHATFKASLFMAAGIIDHETGSRDMRRLNGLAHYMPVTAVLAIVAAASMAGVPLLNGFLSKEMFFTETLFVDNQIGGRFLIPALATLATAFSVTYSLRFIHDVFWNGEPVGLERTPHDPPFWMLVPVGILVLVCVLVGTLPQYTVGPILEVSAREVLGGNLPAYKLAIWHGLNLPLGMSMLASLTGIGFYFSLQRLFRLHDYAHLRRGGKEVYNILVFGLLSFSRRFTGGLDTGRLQAALAWLFGAMLATGGAAFLAGNASGGDVRTLARPVAVALWAIGIGATAAVLILHRHRLPALIALGAVGLVVSLAFAGLSAPDLALTQLLVEFVSIILIVLALNYLPGTAPIERFGARQVMHGVLAAGAGTGAAWLAWLVLTSTGEPMAGYFLENALPRAFGRNVVNVILVDFRGFDTLGEVTVFAIAGLVVYSLLHAGDRHAPVLSGPDPERSLALQLVSLLLLPVAMTVSLFLFLRGHNLPGGGFIGGLVLAVGVLIPCIAFGLPWMDQRLRVDYHRAIGAGLLLAAVTGAGAFLAGHPLLTSTYWKPVLPLLGPVPVASALFFDLGIYLVVAASALLALIMIGRLRSGTGRDS